MQSINLNDINTILNSSLVSALLGSLVGGLITWWVTSRSLNKQFEYQKMVANEEKIKTLIEALVSVRSEIRDNTKNLYNSTLEMNDYELSLEPNLFTDDKLRKYRDIIEIEKGEEFIDKINECFQSMYGLYSYGDLLVPIFIEAKINEGEKIQIELAKEIEKQRKILNGN